MLLLRGAPREPRRPDAGRGPLHPVVALPRRRPREPGRRHARCNAQKSDFLAAAAHVDHWRARTRSESPVAAALDRLAETIGWTRHPQRTLGVARALYLRLPEDARLWLRGEEFVTADRPALEAALDATTA